MDNTCSGLQIVNRPPSSIQPADTMIKCLLSYDTSHHVLYLKCTPSADHLTFDQFKLNLISHYDNLIKQLNVNLLADRFEIYDGDFEQYVTVDKWTQIKNLSKLRATRWSADRCSNQCSNTSKMEGATEEGARRASTSVNNSALLNSSNGLSASVRRPMENTTINQSASIGEHLNESHSKQPSTAEQHRPGPNGSESNKGSQPSDRQSLSDSIQGLQSDLRRGLPTDFNKLPLTDLHNRTAPLNTSFKTYQVAECQTDETERRVIHLKDNLFKQHCVRLKDDYYRLLEENKRLNAKLELYKQGSVANATNYLEDFVYNADEIERLKKELAEAKEEQKAIMEAFKKKSKEFRRVVYLLTGFKFDALEQRKYRVSHIYSNPNEYLFFTLEKEEVINLLGNEFSEKFYKLINTYLVEYGSYPSFLASITLKLFKEKQAENSKKDAKQ